MSDIIKIRNQIKQHFEKKKEKHYKEYIAKKNSYWSKYYHDTRWGRLRNAYYAQHPLCECCLEDGLVVPAEHCHHRVPFSTGITEEAKWNLLLNPNNLIMLCEPCHKLFHKLISERHVEQVSIKEVLDYKHEQEELNNLINN